MYIEIGTFKRVIRNIPGKKQSIRIYNFVNYTYKHDMSREHFYETSGLGL